MNILDLKRKLMPLSGFMGGGSPASSSSTATTGLPEWAKGYAQDTLAKQAALSDRPYEAYGANRIQGFTPMQEQARQNAANMNAGPEGFSQGISAYMSPYQQQVTDIQKREAGRQSGIMGTQQQAQAAQVGAFGGSRDAIMRAERERNLGQQMGDIQARGDQANFDQASNQFRQGITQGMDVNRLQSAYGAQEQAMGQRGLDQSYQDYQNQREYPQQQLSNISSMMRGLPIGSTSTSTGYQNPGSPSFGQMLGSVGTAAYGLKQFFADGGSVDSQQNIESIVSKLLDPQLDQAEEAAKARGDQEQLRAIQMEKAARASMRRGLGAMPVNMDEMLPTEQSMARGGIVAFADGGIRGKSGDPDIDIGGDDVEETNAPAEGPGNQAVYDEALRNQLAQIKALTDSKYESMDPEEYDRRIEARRASLIKGAGESPYAGMREDVKRMEEDSAKNLKEGKGLAALQAAAAMLEGNSFSRAVGAGVSTFAGAYSAAAKASQAEKDARQRKLENIADAERKEKMGFNTAAIAAADQARKDHHDEQRAKVEKIKAMGVLNSKLAASAKPGAAKAPTPTKVAEQLAAAEIALENNPKDPEAQRNVAALRRAAAQLAQKTVFSTTEYGGGRLGSAEAGQDINRQKYASDREKDMLKQAQFTPEFRNLKPEEQTRRKADIKNEARAYYGLPPEAPAAAPKAAPAAPAKAVPASQIPAGTTFGKAVPGKGTEVLKDGKVIGYAN
jgi:hypothetical protein